MNVYKSLRMSCIGYYLSVVPGRCQKFIGLLPKYSQRTMFRSYRGHSIEMSLLNERKVSVPLTLCCRKFTSESSSESNKIHHPTYLESISQSTVVVRLKDLENHFKYRGYSILRWAAGIIVAAGMSVYVFRDLIRENISDEVADVATRSMGDEVVVMKVNELSKSLVHEIINDAETLSFTSKFITDLLNDEKVLQSAKDFVIKVLNDPSTKETVHSLAAQTFSDLLKSEDTRTLLLDYLKGILLDDHTRETCQNLLDGVSQEERSREIMATFFKSVITSDTVKSGAVELGKDVTAEIVDDVSIQEKTGSAIWNSIKHTMMPRWFSS